MPPPRVTHSGYTLIELLVVVALIAVLTAAVGLGLRGANAASALTATQALVRGQIDAARARAALNGRPAAFALFADAAESTRYLRELGVAEQTATGEWTLVTDGLAVPGGVRFALPAEGATAWTGPVAVAWDAAGGTSLAFLVPFAPNGALAAVGGGELWWSAEDTNGRGGMVISRYGAVVAVDPPAEGEEEGS